MRARRPPLPLLLALLLALVPATASSGGEGEIPAVPSASGRGSGAARLPDSRTGGDYWELLARFESGHVVFVQTLVTRLGWGGHKAAVVGVVIEPDGETRPFRRTEEEDGFTLSDDGLTLDLQAARLEQGRDSRHLRVRKSGLVVEVDVASERAGVGVDGTPEGCSMDILEVSSPATGSLKPRGAAEATMLAGRASFTHRWLDQLEAGCATRRLELFVFHEELGLYLSELLTPSGEILRWSVLHRGGDTVFADHPAGAETQWSQPRGEPVPVSLSVQAGGLDIQVRDVGEPLLHMDLLDRVPKLFRPLIALKTEPSVRLLPATFTATGQAGRAIEGQALVKVLYLNPIE